MQNKKTNSIAVDQDGLAYQWLEENTALIGNLKPGQDLEQYNQTLQKIILEGKNHLRGVHPDDPALDCFLSLLAAEAQVDLALVEKDASRRKELLIDGCENCRRVVDSLEKYGISGFACNILPRIITILSGAYLAAANDQRPVVEDSLKKAADLLDEFRIQQTYERQKAVEKLLEGRIFALSTSEMPDLTDRRLVLEKAAASLRQAAGFSGMAFDDELGKEADLCLEEVDKSLRLVSLPVPVLPIPAEPAKPVPLPLVCPGCGAPLKPTNRFCRSCGRPVAHAEARSALTQPAPENNPARVCPKCGGEVRPGVKFCRNCGQKLMEEEIPGAS